jgi:hypothetical protein
LISQDVERFERRSRSVASWRASSAMIVLRQALSGSARASTAVTIAGRSTRPYLWGKCCQAWLLGGQIRVFFESGLVRIIVPGCHQSVTTWRGAYVSVDSSSGGGDDRGDRARGAVGRRASGAPGILASSCARRAALQHVLGDGHGDHKQIVDPPALTRERPAPAVEPPASTYNLLMPRQPTQQPQGGWTPEEIARELAVGRARAARATVKTPREHLEETVRLSRFIGELRDGARSDVRAR